MPAALVVCYSRIIIILKTTRKIVPITGPVSPFLIFLEFSKTNREEGERQQQQTYQFTQGYNIFSSRVQVNHLTLTFIIHNIYIYIYIYIHVYILEKWFPLQGERGHSSYFWSFQKQNREEGVREQNQQAYQFTQGYNILVQTKSTSPNPNLYHTQ